MKVLMINGSRNEKGCTYTALTLIAEELLSKGIESEILYIGRDAVNGNIDKLTEQAREKMAASDALVIGSPVYYASASGEVIAFLDRFFGKAAMELKHKPAAVIASARRAGTTATLDVLAKYPGIAEMPIVSSCYWHMVHGSRPEDVMKDEEGVQVMKTLGSNMAWLLKCLEAGKAAGIETPAPARKPMTNFIR